MVERGARWIHEFFLHFAAREVSLCGLKRITLDCGFGWAWSSLRVINKVKNIASGNHSFEGKILK
jgi:hypothetical protein